MPSAWAAAETGFGISGGISSTDADELGIRDNVGPAIGFDYQFALSDQFSLSPFLQYASEEGKIDVAPFGSFDVTVKTLSYGVQARGWVDEFFAGGHLAAYDLTLDLLGSSASESGFGFGAVLGWEAEGGFFAHLQYDSFTIGSGSNEIDLTSTRVFAGFRFK